jgi:hypothetical protein
MKLPRDRAPISIRAACGQQVSEDSAFCSRCGKPLPKVPRDRLRALSPGVPLSGIGQVIHE